MSYSVSSQGTSPLQTPQETHDVDVDRIENLASTPNDLAATTDVPSIEKIVSKDGEIGDKPELSVYVKHAGEAAPAGEPLTPQIVAIDEV